MTRLSHMLERGNNNFDLLRLIAALLVIYGHSFWALPAKAHPEPVLNFTQLEYTGSLAVYAFFLLSGLLVSKSFASQRSTVVFMTHRVSRILPAFFVCTVLTAFVIGPFVTTLRPFEYFRDPLLMHWWWHTVTLMFGVGTYLPGVFPDTPIRSLVNATTWTLPVEIKCYALVLAAGLCGAIGNRGRTIVVCVLAITGLFFLATHPTSIRAIDDVVAKPLGYSFYPVVMFLVGMLGYAFRQSIILDGRIAIALLIAYFVSRTTSVGIVLFYPAFVYGVATFASLRALRFRLPGDYSFGLYLWGFPVQQIVADINPTMNNYLGLLIVIPATLLLAVVSWHLVEQPAIRFAANLLNRQALTPDRA